MFNLPKVQPDWLQTLKDLYNEFYKNIRAWETIGIEIKAFTGSHIGLKT